jgi:hypothetical protein
MSGNGEITKRITPSPLLSISSRANAITFMIVVDASTHLHSRSPSSGDFYRNKIIFTELIGI